MQNTESTRPSDRRGSGPSSQAPTRRLAPVEKNLGFAAFVLCLQAESNCIPWMGFPSLKPCELERGVLYCDVGLRKRCCSN